MSERENIELFLQGEGIAEILLVRVPHDCTVRELIEKAKAEAKNLQHDGGEMVLLLEDSDDEMNPDARLNEVGIKHRQRVHCHRCRRIEVTVNYNSQSQTRKFSPARTIGRVKRWADDQFGLKGVDATEHALQLCGTDTRPDEDVHLGALVRYPNCTICFDLVPKKRVEG